MAFEMIRLDVAAAVATIILDRPDRLNSAPPQMFDEIAQALDHLNGARALVITGAGRAFCSGADLGDRKDADSTSPGDFAYGALTRHYAPTLLKLSKLGVPVICAVNGPAAGIGCSIALAGDLVIAGKSAYFLQAFVNVGLIADGGASWMLPRFVGKARAAEMLLLGERIAAEKAAEWGLIYKCVEDAELLTEARALGERLAKGPTAALRIIRQTLASSLETNFAAALALEAEGQREAANTADAAEGKRAFREKRKPAFEGI
jgi:2-(1,2-epoxy-1,2-dihydrophenyl)acetyl-CoA isomerase